MLINVKLKNVIIKRLYHVFFFSYQGEIRDKYYNRSMNWIFLESL